VNLEELWLGKNKIERLEVRNPSASEAKFLRLDRSLESRKLETPAIVIDAVEPSDKTREPGGTRES
jgi:hypothetical protein